HWVISNASTTTYAPLEAGFCWPVTSIVRVWPVAARLVALKTTAWTCSVGEYVSTSATRTGLSRSLLNLAECGGSPSYLPFTAARGITDIAAPGEKIDPEPIVAARFRRR